MVARSSITVHHHPSPNSDVFWGPTEMPAGRLEGVLGQRRATRGDGPDPNADVPCEDNWRSGGQIILHPLYLKHIGVVIPGLIAIDVYQCIILYHCIMLYHSVIPFPWIVSA